MLYIAIGGPHCNVWVEPIIGEADQVFNEILHMYMKPDKIIYDRELDRITLHWNDEEILDEQWYFARLIDIIKEA